MEAPYEDEVRVLLINLNYEYICEVGQPIDCDLSLSGCEGKGKVIPVTGRGGP
jgi:hypothetical protein